MVVAARAKSFVRGLFSLEHVFCYLCVPGMCPAEALEPEEDYDDNRKIKFMMARLLCSSCLFPSSPSTAGCDASAYAFWQEGRLGCGPDSSFGLELRQIA